MKRDLHSGQQVDDWLREAATKVSTPAKIILIGFGGLLWHAFQKGLKQNPPDFSSDIDPITMSEEVAAFGYDCMIGSEFELTHGFHVNLMPEQALHALPGGWESRATRVMYELLEIIVPSPDDLLAPKLARGEPRDIRHQKWAENIGLTRAGK